MPWARVRLQAIEMLTLEPERLQNRLATTREKMGGFFSETLKWFAPSPPPRSLLDERPAQYTFHCSLRVLLRCSYRRWSCATMTTYSQKGRPLISDYNISND